MRQQYYVRPLKWATNEMGTFGELCHDSIYYVTLRKGTYTLYNEASWQVENLGEYTSIGAYKEAAQKHFEKRLTSTLLKPSNTTPKRRRKT
jgi:hypothetical protein